MGNKYWSDAVKNLTPYTPGEQPLPGEVVTKLNTNENPYPPSPQVKQAVAAALADGGALLRLYPDANGSRLKNALAAYHGVGPQQIFLGNGSDEVLAHAFLGLLKHKSPVLFPDITYSFYSVYCGLYQIPYEKMPLGEEFTIRIDDYLRPERRANGGIVIANPNAPTGIALALEEIKRLVENNQQSVVVVDEAYVDYGAQTAIPLVHSYQNVLVVRTFSKSRAMAGMRLAYAIGHPTLIDGLNRVKDSFNSYPLDVLAQAAGIASIEDNVYFEQRLQEVVDSRQRLVAQLEQLGFEVLPSAANFVFTCHPKIKAADLAEQLKKRRILVRHFKIPRIENYLRISVGSTQECDTLYQACESILKQM